MSGEPRLKVVFDSARIGERVRAIAKDINRVYRDKPVAAICVLKGAFMFFGDLVRALDRPDIEVDFVRLASYGKNMTSRGHVRFIKDIELDIRGKHVLVIEDIVDSGRSMRFLLDQLSARSPATLSLAALVDKKERRSEEVRVDFGGFELPSGFLVGYGLDYAEKYRTLPDICELEFTDEKKCGEASPWKNGRDGAANARRLWS